MASISQGTRAPDSSGLSPVATQIFLRPILVVYII
jgi:hypothetical protein